MNPITQVTVTCMACKWQGRVIDCEFTSDAAAMCPECGFTVLAAQAETAEYPTSYFEKESG